MSVRQPWAYAILRLGKDVENRANRKGQDAARKQFAHTGPLLIHASTRTAGPEAWREIERLAPGHPLPALGGSDPATQLGAVIGIVTVHTVHTADACSNSRDDYGYCSRWAQPDAAHLMLTQPRVLAHPIYLPGRLGLWSITDALTLAAISRELA
ncbi:MAG: hypothetical protein EPO65_00455 [Dehalococcoidia bacterium]|nr:MAG: hypothetical protein EPO65_00455 [Dehalococcoidia bacterium]